MIKTITVIGSGVMGQGIAQSFALAGYPVFIHDIKHLFLEKAAGAIDGHLSLMVQSGGLSADQKKSALSRLTFTVDQQEAVSDTDLIIEAIPEDIHLKWALYQELKPLIREEAIVTSNTSTFPISLLTQKNDFGGRFIITHFFNPAHLVPLVEIVKNEKTKPEVVDEVVNVLKRANKSPVILKKEINGFIANRLQTALMREAFSLIEEGVASPEDIDRAITDGPGFRWAFVGPTRIADFGGLDTWKHVFDNIAPELDESEGAPEVINRLVSEKKLGTKTGEGLFKYTGNEIKDELNRRDDLLIRLGRIKQQSRSPIHE